MGARVAGIDPGSVSFDVCMLEAGEPLAARSFPSDEVAGDQRG